MMLGINPKLKNKTEFINSLLEVHNHKLGTYRTIKDHQALIKVMVLHDWMAVQLSKWVLTSETWLVEERKKSLKYDQFPQHISVINFLLVNWKRGYFIKINPAIFSPSAGKTEVSGKYMSRVKLFSNINVIAPCSKYEQFHWFLYLLR